MTVEVVEKLDCACVVVADLSSQSGRRIAKFLDDILGQPKGRGHFDYLLVTALHGTVPFEEVDDVAVAVSEDLNLDVFGPGDVFFEEYGRVAESALGLALGLIKKTGQFRFFFDHSHASTTAAEGRLDDEGEADLACGLHGLIPIGDGLIGAGQGGYSNALGHGPCGRLVTHHVQKLWAGSNEGDARLGAGAGEGRIFAQKSVARMDGVDPLGLGGGHDALDVQVGGDRALTLTDQVGLIGLEAVNAEPVLLRIDGHSAQIEFSRRPEDADRDFGAVGRQELPEWTSGRRDDIGMISGRHGWLPQWLRKTRAT